MGNVAYSDHCYWLTARRRLRRTLHPMKFTAPAALASLALVLLSGRGKVFILVNCSFASDLMAYLLSKPLFCPSISIVLEPAAADSILTSKSFPTEMANGECVTMEQEMNVGTTRSQSISFTGVPDCPVTFLRGLPSPYKNVRLRLSFKEVASSNDICAVTLSSEGRAGSPSQGWDYGVFEGTWTDPLVQPNATCYGTHTLVMHMRNSNTNHYKHPVVTFTVRR